MKRFFIFVILLGLLVTGCSNNDGGTEELIPTATPVVVVTPSPTPVPDFSDTDFSGTWYVSGVILADGKTLSEDEISRLDTFTLELLPNGTYFLYREDGSVMGQGEYSITDNRLVFSADGQETVYLIQDENTLHGTAPDDSITVMTRRIEDPEEEDDTETDVPDEDTPDDETE